MCGVSSTPHGKPNGKSPPIVSPQMSPMKTRRVTLSQLNDQDWLLFCDQFGNVGDIAPSAERPGTSMGHQNPTDGCGCSCLEACKNSVASSFQRVTVQDCLSSVSNKRTLSSSPQTQLFSQSSQISCQVLSQQINQGDLSKPASNHPQDNCMPHCSEDGRKVLFQQQHCNHFKLKNTGQTTCANLFNIPLNPTECSKTNQTISELQEHPLPPVDADDHWRQLFGKEPILVQEHEKQDTHLLISGDQTCKSFGDPSIILKCHHLTYNPLISASQVKRSSTPASNRSVHSFSTSHYSSLENQDLVEERARQRPSQVNSFTLNFKAARVNFTKCH